MKVLGFIFSLFYTGETPGKTQDTLERLCLSAGLGMPRGPPGRAGGSGRGQERLGFSAQAAAPATRPPEKWQIMDGWMDVLHFVQFSLFIFLLIVKNQLIGQVIWSIVEKIIHMSFF